MKKREITRNDRFSTPSITRWPHILSLDRKTLKSQWEENPKHQSSKCSMRRKKGASGASQSHSARNKRRRFKTKAGP